MTTSDYPAEHQGAPLLHRSIVIPADDWEKFEAWTHALAREVPALQELASTPPVWQD